jgi:hypothetical protein
MSYVAGFVSALAFMLLASGLGMRASSDVIMGIGIVIGVVVTVSMNAAKDAAQMAGADMAEKQALKEQLRRALETAPGGVPDRVTPPADEAKPAALARRPAVSLSDEEIREGLKLQLPERRGKYAGVRFVEKTFMKLFPEDFDAILAEELAECGSFRSDEIPEALDRLLKDTTSVRLCQSGRDLAAVTDLERRPSEPPGGPELLWFQVPPQTQLSTAAPADLADGRRFVRIQVLTYGPADGRVVAIAIGAA